MEKLKRVDPNHKLIQAGSSLKFCRIATGEADIYPRMDSIMEWDIAAGQAIVRAAGGTMIRWPEQTVPQYTSKDMRSPKFLAIAPGRDADGILERLK
jgi:3'(2'), 5'-bisphosphate nucleotidase